MTRKPYGVMGRPSKYGDTCNAAGCDAPRHPTGKGKRSPFCHAHHLEHERLRYAGTEGVPTPTPAPTPVHSIAEVYERWGKEWCKDVFYGTRQVLGIAPCGDFYRLTLKGLDASVLVGADALLSEKGTP